MAAIETIPVREPKSASGGQPASLTNFLKSGGSSEPEASRRAAAPPVHPAPTPSTPSRPAKAVPAWSPSHPRDRQLVDMAAQIAAAYVANHSVTAASTAKYITEVHQALLTLVGPDSPQRSIWPRRLLFATAGTAVLTALAGGAFFLPGAHSGDTADVLSRPALTSENTQLIVDPAPIAPSSMMERPTGAGEGASVPTIAVGSMDSSDWAVMCGLPSTQGCVIGQEAGSGGGAGSAQILIHAGTGEELTGTLTLPFDVSLDSRVTLQTGAGALDGPLTLTACSPQGCGVTLNFNTEQVEALRRGVLLQANATGDDGRTLSYIFSLNGFSAAHNRLLAAQSTQDSRTESGG